MTDNEIIECAESCISEKPPCISCPFDEDTNTTDECMGKLLAKLIEVSNRQKAEIKRLQAMVDAELDTIHDLGDDYERVLEEENELVKTAKTEAIKEFAEKLKKQMTFEGISALNGKFKSKKFTDYEIDNLVKEMTE